MDPTSNHFSPGDVQLVDVSTGEVMSVPFTGHMLAAGVGHTLVVPQNGDAPCVMRPRNTH